MPLIKVVTVNENIIYGIWEISEDIESLVDQEEFINHEEINIPGLHPKKQLEYVTSRILIANLCKGAGINYHGLIKDEFGKPYLKNCQYHLSVSHSFPYAIAVIHKKSAVGIDIEFPNEKISRISSKFLNDNELKYENSLLELCKVWCIKETLYKIYGRKKVDFKKHLHVSLGSGEKNPTGKFTKDDIDETYEIITSSYDGFIYCFNL